MGLRRGTEIWVVGGETDPSPALPASGEGENHIWKHALEHNNCSSPPLAGGTGGAASLAGRAGGSTHALLPIEALRPDDLVLAHDGQPHRIDNVRSSAHHGPLVGLRHYDSWTILWLTTNHLVLVKTRPRTLGGQRDWSAAPPSHVQRSRELRRKATAPERRLWAVLRRGQLGFKFRRQHPVGPYIADFYSREAHLVVEVDGAAHFEPQARAYDAQRNAYMRTLGLQVVRFTAREIAANLDGVCQTIWHACHTWIESTQGAQWLPAGEVIPGDLVCRGLGTQLAEVAAVETIYGEEEVLDLVSSAAPSFLTLVCAVHPCKDTGRGPS